MTNETQVMPAVALRGITILPDMIVHFDVSRKKSIRAIEEAMTKDQRIFLITQKDPKVEEPSEDDLYKIGTVAMIKQVAKAPKDMLRVLVEGMERAELMQLEDGTSYLEAEVDVLEQEEENLPDTVKEAMLLSMRELFSVYCKENQKMNQEQVRQTLEIDDITDLVDHIAVNIPLTFKQRQQILESTSFSERYEILGVILSNEIEVMRLRTEIQEKVKQRIDKNQRDYILREQLKLIREELGEDDTVSDGDHFMQEAEKLQAPKEIKERLIKEIRRFKSLGYNNSESSVSRGYIETLLKLPWEKSSRDNRNLDKASQILEADHYGLEKVKERVLEFLAVRTLTKKGSSPILCLVGPPGTGKTSISTGLGFFDHMLDQIGKHSGTDLTVRVKGDLEVDEHHTIEDTAIALGEAMLKALGDKRGIERYGYCLPMDDCLCSVALDFGGRPWLVWDAEFHREKVGDMPTEMFLHFFKSLSDAARMNLNIRAEGMNEHHKIEGIFKALARSIKMAIRRDIYRFELPSTKGLL